MIDSSITLFTGLEPVLSAYVGTTLVYPSAQPPVPPTPVGPYDEMYFTTRALEDRVHLIAYIDSGVTSATSLSVSTDSGQTWRTVTLDGTGKRLSIVLDSGQTAIWKGIADSWGISWFNHLCFNTENSKRFEVEGNIMSLLYGDNFIGQTQLNANSVFTCLFYQGNYYGLVNAENLVLPATSLTDYCYSRMFEGCRYLTKAPELPSTTLAYRCYSSMFNGCLSLSTAPDLPATSLTDYCYSRMFEGCRYLTKAPELPATTLADYCYNGMFGGCTSLTTAPELPATTLAQGCYNNMFSTCTNLNSVKCLATDISASNCTNDWFNNVSSSGTFTKASGVSWPTGGSGIPSGWTVVEA